MDLYKGLLIVFSLFIGSTLSLAQDAPQANKRSWHRYYTDSLQGTRSEEALEWLRKHKQRAKPVIVAVVDTGLDTATSELKRCLAINQREPMDGKDNDGNGYIDDRWGWNLLGTADGKLELTSVGREEYREFKRLHPKYKSIAHIDSVATDDRAEYLYYQRMRTIAGIDRYLRLYDHTLAKARAYTALDSIITTKMPETTADSLSVSEIMNIKPDSKDWVDAAEVILADLIKADSSATWSQLKRQHHNQLNLIRSRVEGIERDIDKRTLLGDDLSNGEDRYYGNANIGGKGSEHGTFVASIIGGAGDIDPKVRGIYPPARILAIKAVPDNGDEYDKDVSTAIRYAVDRGARVINLSLGKYASANPRLVDEAMAYALKKDVLIIHSSGNNGYRLDASPEDKRPYYPKGTDSMGKPWEHYLRIGALDKQGARAKFSNYGASVDLYAPGVDIWAVMPNDKIEASQGTSLSAPIVSGIATMLRAYYPKLKASQIKEILIKSARLIPEGKPSENPHQPILRAIDAMRAVQCAEETQSKPSK